MNALDHIINWNEITINSSRRDALDEMLRTYSFELPVIKDDKLFGVLRLEDCFDSDAKTVESLVDPGCPYVYVGTHLFDIMDVMHRAGTSVCAVLSEDDKVLGFINKSGVFDRLATSISIEQSGAVILIEMATHQYSSSEISRIIESENTQLLGLWVEHVPDSGRIRASLKINTANAERIVNSLQRFNYEVIATFGDLDYKEKVEKRYQALMKYLDL